MHCDFVVFFSIPANGANAATTTAQYIYQTFIFLPVVFTTLGAWKSAKFKCNCTVCMHVYFYRLYFWRAFFQLVNLVKLLDAIGCNAISHIIYEYFALTTGKTVLPIHSPSSLCWISKNIHIKIYYKCPHTVCLSVFNKHTEDVVWLWLKIWSKKCWMHRLCTMSDSTYDDDEHDDFNMMVVKVVSIHTFKWKENKEEGNNRTVWLKWNRKFLRNLLAKFWLNFSISFLRFYKTILFSYKKEISFWGLMISKKLVCIGQFCISNFSISNWHFFILFWNRL